MDKRRYMCYAKSWSRMRSDPKEILRDLEEFSITVLEYKKETDTWEGIEMITTKEFLERYG